jgi:hypothetical protein
MNDATLDIHRKVLEGVQHSFDRLLKDIREGVVLRSCGIVKLDILADILDALTQVVRFNLIQQIKERTKEAEKTPLIPPYCPFWFLCGGLYVCVVIGFIRLFS